MSAMSLLFHPFDFNSAENYCFVGVLTQEVTGKLIEYYGNHYSYVASSYVKHLESAGSRVIPVWIGKDKEYYKSILSLVNGVLFPGGATLFNVTGGYAEAGKLIMEVADVFNNQGDYFPIWGTCLGFELMGYIENNMEEIRVDCESNNQALPLEFKPGFLNSKLFGEAPCDIVLTLRTFNSTINFHQYCITEQGMKDAGLLETWRILATNTDTKGLQFVSVMEHITKPYYAVQFHPEKPAFEWKASHATPHDSNSIRANQYFADFFVQQGNCTRPKSSVIIMHFPGRSFTIESDTKPEASSQRLLALRDQISSLFAQRVGNVGLNFNICEP